MELVTDPVEGVGGIQSADAQARSVGGGCAVGCAEQAVVRRGGKGEGYAEMICVMRIGAGGDPATMSKSFSESDMAPRERCDDVLDPVKAEKLVRVYAY